MDEYDAQTIADIDRFGWIVRRIIADEGPDFAFSIGLFHSFGHPELLIYGLAPNVIGHVINEIGERIRDGERYVAGQTVNGFLEGYAVTFRPIPLAQYAAHLGGAIRHYRGRDFPALQVVYPDFEHRWPWDAGVDNELLEAQPVLAERPVQ
jgi:hypothetical protein